MVNFAKEAKVDIVITDSDGYVEDLIPLIVETGVTGMYPFERAAGNDMLRIRKNFPDFQLIGGFDKRVLFADSSKDKIDPGAFNCRRTVKKRKVYSPYRSFCFPGLHLEKFHILQKKAE